MLGYAPFYYQTIRRNVVCFGNIFKDITLVKYNRNNRAEIDRRIVPLVYSGKENYLTRLLSAPELPRPVELVLPSMSFMITGLQYDPNRKLQSSLQNFNATGASAVNTQYVGVPYNLDFELNIYIRNLDDGLQILEQILPFFNPDYTLTMNVVDEMGLSINVPLILNGAQIPTEFEGEATDTERRLVWTLNFTMQTQLFGPVSSGGLIKTANVSTFSFATGTDIGSNEQLLLTTANTPLGNFSIGETIYQGPTLPQANAVGVVASWNPKGGQMAVSLISGAFVANANVYGTNFNSSVEIISVPQSIPLAIVVDTTNPANANVEMDFGFITTITEFPQTE